MLHLTPRRSAKPNGGQSTSWAKAIMQDAMAVNPVIPSSPAVSRRMSLQRTSNTAAELKLRRILHHDGFRYRLGRRPMAEVPCRPDLVFGPAKVAVFLAGCFWPVCP